MAKTIILKLLIIKGDYKTLSCLYGVNIFKQTNEILTDYQKYIIR